MGAGQQGGWGIGGTGADRSVTEREIIWGGSQAAIAALWLGNCVVSGAARDAGNTVTSVLRPGLLLGKITASGLYVQWDYTATDGSQYIRAVLDQELKMIDFDAANADREIRLLVGRAPLKASMLLCKGVALTSATEQYLARKQLRAAGFVLDDDPFGYLTGDVKRELLAGNTTITADQNGTFFKVEVAATLTLPAIKPGLNFEFINLTNTDLVVASAEGDNIVGDQDVDLDSIAGSTSSHKIGWHNKLESITYGNGTPLYWAWSRYSPLGVLDTVVD